MMPTINGQSNEHWVSIEMNWKSQPNLSQFVFNATEICVRLGDGICIVNES